jgi:prolipoprotein diacylglyceryltransferase
VPLDQVPLRHPSQLYEAAWGLAVLGFLLVVDRVYGEQKRREGLLFGLFLSVYFTGRFFLEYFKAYQTLDPESALTMGQWLSIPLVLFGAWWIWRACRQPLSEPSARSE